MKLTYQTPLTDEMIRQAELYVGMQLRIEQYNNEATRDTIRHFAWGIGDGNPLWCDPRYAAKTRFGDIVAPPSFLFSIYSGAMGLGFVGLQPFYAGAKWDYFETVRRGDQITADARVGPMKVLGGAHAKRFVLQTVLTDYIRQDGVLVARSEGRTFRVPRAEAEGGLSYSARGPHQYSPEEVEEIRRQAVSEPVRGAVPRYWADVKVGDEIPAVVKGPIDQITMTAFYGGILTTPSYKACEMGHHYRTWASKAPHRLPTNYDRTFFGEAVSPLLGHQNNDVARQVGMPSAYANGSQRCSWFIHAITNWMGDDGILETFEGRLGRPDLYGDTVWIRGRVTALPAPGSVGISLRSENQRGEETATATAQVRLPMRGEPS